MVGDCPIVEGWGNRHCTDIRDQPSDNPALDEYGEGSRCFEMYPNTKWQILNMSSSRIYGYSVGQEHACYKYNCDNSALHILVHDQAFECERSGKRIDVKIIKDGSTHTGKINLESRRLPSCVYSE